MDKMASSIHMMLIEFVAYKTVIKIEVAGKNPAIFFFTNPIFFRIYITGGIIMIDIKKDINFRYIFGKD
ncbi:hypothetical protein, partial [Floccifex sp.]|uniref:hypothetical protein n=1 Tax=Floccifex sp. TaxID=2815810 RepID=UPI003F02E77F